MFFRIDILHDFFSLPFFEHALFQTFLNLLNISIVQLARCLQGQLRCLEGDPGQSVAAEPGVHQRLHPPGGHSHDRRHPTLGSRFSLQTTTTFWTLVACAAHFNFYPSICFLNVIKDYFLITSSLKNK